MRSSSASWVSLVDNSISSDLSVSGVGKGSVVSIPSVRASRSYQLLPSESSSNRSSASSNRSSASSNRSSASSEISERKSEMRSGSSKSTAAVCESSSRAVSIGVCSIASFDVLHCSGILISDSGFDIEAKYE